MGAFACFKIWISAGFHPLSFVNVTLSSQQLLCTDFFESKCDLATASVNYRTNVRMIKYNLVILY